MKKFLVIALLLAALQLAGCGGSGETGSGRDATAPDASGSAAATGSNPTETAKPGDWAKLKKYAGSLAGDLVIPHGPAPEREFVKDLRLGKGPVIGAGDTFMIRWVGFNYRDGRLLQPFWHSPRRYTWGRFVDAWDAGLRGMRIGGIRELIAPSSLSYGDGAFVYLVQPLKLE